MAINEKKLEEFVGVVSDLFRVVEHMLDPKKEKCRKKSGIEYELGMFRVHKERLRDLVWEVIEDKEEE